jgi:hypothetical protein
MTYFTAHKKWTFTCVIKRLGIITAKDKDFVPQSKPAVIVEDFPPIGCGLTAIQTGNLKQTEKENPQNRKLASPHKHYTGGLLSIKAYSMVKHISTKRASYPVFD